MRRVPAGSSWHPATDRLQGSQEYGTYDHDLQSQKEFSVAFDDVEYDEFLFATGDMKVWLRATADSVHGDYAGEKRPIIASSVSGTPSEAVWYNRSECSEDPWISTVDHMVAIGEGQIVYGGAGFRGQHAANVLPSHSGANVFIRLSLCNQAILPCIDACLAGDVAALAAGLDALDDVDAIIPSRKKTLLRLACEQGFEDGAQLLIDRGASVNTYANVRAAEVVTVAVYRLAKFVFSSAKYSVSIVLFNCSTRHSI